MKANTVKAIKIILSKNKSQVSAANKIVTGRQQKKRILKKLQEKSTGKNQMRFRLDMTPPA